MRIREVRLAVGTARTAARAVAAIAAALALAAAAEAAVAADAARTPCATTRHMHQQLQLYF
jgi:hypothetical protein